MWNIDSLKEHLESEIANDRHTNEELRMVLLRSVEDRIDALRDTQAASLLALKEAAEKAEAAQEKRNEHQNEWRATLEDFNATTLSRTEAVTMINAVSAKVDENRRTYSEKFDMLEARFNRNEGTRQGVGTTVWMMLAVASLVVSIVLGVVSLTGMHAAITTATTPTKVTDGHITVTP